jgi:hypothetical protein
MALIETENIDKTYEFFIDRIYRIDWMITEFTVKRYNSRVTNMDTDGTGYH